MLKAKPICLHRETILSLLRYLTILLTPYDDLINNNPASSHCMHAKKTAKEIVTGFCGILDHDHRPFVYEYF